MEADAAATLDFVLALLEDDRADIYLAGHDHDMQHLKPEGRLHFFVAGSGGKLRPITAGPRSLFARSAHGLAVLEIDASRLAAHSSTSKAPSYIATTSSE